MKVSTSRFGELFVEKADLIHFPEGILGFEQLKKFFIVDPGDQTYIMWLQSTDTPHVAFPIIEPSFFIQAHESKLLPSEMNSLKLESLQDAKIFCILTIPQDITQMTANLKAPIVINNQLKVGKQIVLQDNKLAVRHEIYLEMKKKLVQLRPAAEEENVQTLPLQEEKPSTEKKSASKRPRRDLEELI